MEDLSKSGITPDFHRDEKLKDELQMQTDADHVPSHHSYVTPIDEVVLPFSCKSDSLALLSVYRYARKIKSFLGWENITEEFEIERDNLKSATDDLRLGKESSSSSSSSSSSGISDITKEKKNGENLSKNQLPYEGVSDISGNKENGSNLDNLDYRSLPDLCDNYACDNNSNLNIQSRKNTPQQNTFRSEVNIYIEDIRQNLSSSSAGQTNLSLEKSQSGRKEIMDESLVQERTTTDKGLILNDEDHILKEESCADRSREIECPGSNDKCTESGKSTSNFKASDEENTKTLSDDLNGDFKSKNNLGKNDSENEKEHCIIPAEDETNINLPDRLLDKNDEYNIGATNNKNVAEQEHISDGQDSQDLTKSLIDNVDKLVSNIVKEKQANNVISSKTDKSLKAHIQYENEITKQPLFKDVTCNGTQNLNRKNSYVSDDTECGFSVFRPGWLQPLATVKIYVILYSILGVLHGSYYSYLIGTLSTLEKRYAFKTKTGGGIMVADEVTPLLLGVIVGYYAGKANRPRMISLGMLLSAGCCFCSSLPYFIYGTVQDAAVQNLQSLAGPSFCDLSSENSACGSEGRPETLPAVLLLVFGSFLKGFGNLSYYAIGLAYLDDNSSKQTTPIYLAIALAMRLLGPLVGFLMSSVFLKLYENPADDPGYGPDDPRWVGAWWIGFFLQGILLIIFTIPIALFPRRLPGQRRMEKNTAPAGEDGFKQIYLGLCSALKRLLTNPVFVLFTINTNMKIFGHYGHSIMLPKYMENQFRLSASEASLYSGAISIFCVMISTLVGGYLIWKCRPTIKKLLAGMITSEAMLCVGFLILIIPRCQLVDMSNFGTNDEGLILNSECNQMCDCSTTSYTPFCGPEGTTYFSPCHAGCTEDITPATSSKMRKEFRNCSCVAALVDQHLNATIYEGYCPDEKCWSQALTYLIIYFILLSISNAFTVAHSMILLRSVHPNDKSIALGTFETFICLFGFIPFPVTFGALVDSACLVWEKTCGETGNCWFYDMSRYAWLLHGFGSLFCSFSTICLIGLYFLSPRVRDLYADDEEEKEEVVNIKLDTVSGSVTKL